MSRVGTSPGWWHDRWSRSWWWTLLLTPLVTLWSGALKDLHSDHLFFILQTQNNPLQQVLPRSFYWPQLVLSWSWSLDLTARLNTALRVGSFVFCVLWLSRLVAVAASIKWWKICISLFVFVVYWSLWWPEVGDSLVYLGSPLGVFSFLAVLGDPTGLAKRRLDRASFIGLMFFASFLTTVTNVLSLIVCLPIMTWILVSHKTVQFPRRLAIGMAHLAGSVLGIVQLRNFSNEETGVTFFGLVTRLQTTRHLWDGTLFLWDNLRLAVLLLVVSLLLAAWLSRPNMAALSLAGFVVSLGVIPTAALKHVQANQMMPRYFAVQLTFGLLIQFLVVFSLMLVFLERRKRKHSVLPPRVKLRAAGQLGVLLATASIVVTAVTPLKFGRDYRDQSGNSKSGKPLSYATMVQLDKLNVSKDSPLLVWLDFWNRYPTLFELQQQGYSALAFDGAQSVFDNVQRDLVDVLRNRYFFVICRPMTTSCRQELESALTSRGLSGFKVETLQSIDDTNQGILEIIVVNPSVA